MALQGAPLKVEGITPHGIIDIELAGTVPRAIEIYNNWKPDLIPIAIRHIFIDFLFLISYGTFLFAACLSLSKRFGKMARKVGVWMSILMILTSVFDALENILMLSTLSAHFKKEIVASTFIFASTKFILAGLGILYIIFSLTAHLLFTKKKIIRLQE